jgi:hypothetical protein
MNKTTIAKMIAESERRSALPINENEITEEMIADRLKNELALFKKGTTQSIQKHLVSLYPILSDCENYLNVVQVKSINFNLEDFEYTGKTPNEIIENEITTLNVLTNHKLNITKYIGVSITKINLLYNEFRREYDNKYGKLVFDNKSKEPPIAVILNFSQLFKPKGNNQYDDFISLYSDDTINEVINECMNMFKSINSFFAICKNVAFTYYLNDNIKFYVTNYVTFFSGGYASPPSLAKSSSCLSSAESCFAL